MIHKKIKWIIFVCSISSTSSFFPFFSFIRQLTEKRQTEKKGRERDVTCNKDRQLETNQECCSNGACDVTIWLLGCSENGHIGLTTETFDFFFNPTLKVYFIVPEVLCNFSLA